MVPDDEVTDYKNIMQVAVKLLYISRYVDRKEFKTAQVLFSEIEQHKEEIVGLYVKEIECELLFLELIANADKKKWSDFIQTGQRDTSSDTRS